MADVTGIAEEAWDRAQLMLVAALGLAILFVSLALIVNTAIYTENLATRSSDIGGGTEAVRYHDAVRTGVGDLIGYANYNENDTYAELRTELDAGVDAFDNHSAMQFAMSDRSVDARLNGTVNGTRIAQTDRTREFTNTSGEGDWTVVQDVEHVRGFQLNVSDDQLNALADNPFEIVIDDGTDTWTLSASTPAGSDIVVTVDGPSGTNDCTASSVDHAWINVTDGTLAGTNCDPLDTFVNDPTTPYEIRFRNGPNATGTYTFIVDNDTLAEEADLGNNPHLVDEPAVGQPFATHSLYAANLTITYETPRLFYNASVRVAPGESDG